MGRIACAGIAALLMLGCATGYGKHSMLNRGGYVDSRISDVVYDIEFRGNGRTGVDDAERYALRRAAEIALREGYSHFVVLTKEAFYRADVTVDEVPGELSTPESFAPNANVMVREHHPNTPGHIVTTTENRPYARMRIRLQNTAETDTGRAYDAKAVWGE